MNFHLPNRSHLIAVLLLLGGALNLIPQLASAQSVAFKQAVAEAAQNDPDLATFYRSTGYDDVWTGRGADRQRRNALIKALSQANAHGLPAERYALESLQNHLKNARSDADRGRLEVELSRVFLLYARDVQTGFLTPSRVDPAIVRRVPYRDRKSYLVNLTQSSAGAFFAALPPQSRGYTALMKEKRSLEKRLARGGWGPTVPTGVLKPGASGAAVVALRNRLMEMGFHKRSASQTYDDALQASVRKFQQAHGLETDGVAGPGTISEINKTVQSRLQSIIVAMERERWNNAERGARHVLVNLTDFTAKIIDDGKVTFTTRSVVGARDEDRQSPEFSDVMEFMVINPSWYVPRSIVTKEYLPELQENPNAVSHIEITDSKGRRIDRSAVDFTQFDARTFPFSMREPPSQGNALGLVKFMFPNRHNIYLHDTPAKNLFAREVRAYSHGCIRLAQPFDFAYALLARQTNDPEGFFAARLATGKESQVDLDQHVPVHIIYRTAIATAKGEIHYRRDVYGRDAKIWTALNRAGVALRAVQG